MGCTVSKDVHHHHYYHYQQAVEAPSGVRLNPGRIYSNTNPESSATEPTTGATESRVSEN